MYHHRDRVEEHYMYSTVEEHMRSCLLLAARCSVLTASRLGSRGSRGIGIPSAVPELTAILRLQTA